MIVKLNKPNIMKLKYILSALTFMISTLTYSQTVLDMSTTEDDFSYTKNGEYYLKDINNYLDNFVGTWTYLEGNKKFELILEKVLFYHKTTNFTGVVNQDYYTDCIKITYKQYENNIPVYQSPTNEIESKGLTKDGILLTGSFTDFNRVSYFACRGCQKAPVGNIITSLNFKISPFNSNIASFKLGKYHLGGYNYELYQGQPLFSVPNDVELTKQ
jgi:hypothetical protein